MTDEPESMVAKDIEKKKMKFPVACAVGSDFDQQYGIRGFPSSFLIDADGFVVWSGHPGNFDEDLLKEQLAKLLPVPELPEGHADIAAHFGTRQYGKAFTALQKALSKKQDDAALKAAADALSKAVETRLAAASQEITVGEYGKAQRLYKELMGPFAGVPGAEAAKPALDELKKNKDAKEELAAADKLDDAVAQFRKGELEKGAKAFASIAKKYADTPSGQRAAELAEQHPLD